MEHSVEEVKLKCGAKGLLIDVPGSPVVSMEIWLRGGDSYAESRDKLETAHIMEHLAFGANEKQPSTAEVSRYVSKNGAYSNAYTSRVFLSYEIAAPDFDFERLLKQLVLQVTKPKFLKKEFEAEFGNVQEEMEFRSNNKWGELSEVMMQRFGWDYNETCLERLELMRNVSLIDVKKHYKKTHTSNNVVFFIAGDISKKREMIEDTLEGLGKLERGAKLQHTKDPKFVGFADSPVVLKKGDIKNVYFSLDCYANCGKSDYEAESLALAVFNYCLSHGFHSRIFGKARKFGGVYSLSCGKSFNIGGTYSWDIYAQVGLENIGKVLELVVDELREIRKNGLSLEEVDEAKLAIKGSLRMAYQTTPEILDFYRSHYNSREVEELKYLSDIEKWIDEVTPELIKKLFTDLIKTKKWGAGFLGNVDEAKAKKWNAKLAEIFED
ncbi:insulinase family protein [Candidatus Saccharibacteria bacterium]|jgi:predicted Zn-dependent peptidase|nr:insulinase family protein [Candidatus Saccharibacteria bacterium]